MTKKINLIAGASVQGGLGVGLMTSAGNPWSVADALADDLVERRLATAVGWTEDPVSVSLSPSVIGQGANASENALALRARLAASGSIAHLGAVGVVDVDRTVFLADDTALVGLGRSTMLRRGAGVYAPLVMGSHTAGSFHRNKFSRSGNVLTVRERWHNKQLGQWVQVRNADDTTINAIAQVCAITDHTWSIPVAGASFAEGGLTGTRLPECIPFRRRIEAISVARTDNMVTLQDPEHNLEPGDRVYIGGTAADASFLGIARVARIVVGESWTCYLAGVNGSPVNSVYLSYNRGIVLRNLYLDGNRAGQPESGGNPSSTPDKWSGMLSAVTANFGMTSLLLDNVAVRGTIGRNFNCYVCDVTVRQAHASDSQEFIQLEGGGSLDIDGVTGTSHTSIAPPYNRDDFIACSGTSYDASSPAGYYDCVSPYGMTHFDLVSIRNVSPEIANNSVKLISSAPSEFMDVRIDCVRRGQSDGLSSASGGTLVGISCDPIAGVALNATRVRKLRVTGLQQLDNRSGKTSFPFAVSPGSTGTTSVTIDQAEIEFSGDTAATGPALVALQGSSANNTINVGVMTIKVPKWTSAAPAATGMVSIGAGVRSGVFIVEVADAVAGFATSAPIIYQDAASTIQAAWLNNSLVAGETANNGVLMRLQGAWGIAGFSNTRSKAGANPFGWAVLAQKSGNIGKVVVVNGSDLNSFSIAGDNAVAIGGAVTTVFIDGSSRWTASGGGYVIHAVNGNWDVFADDGASVTSGRVINIANLGTGVCRINGKSLQQAIDGAPSLKSKLTRAQHGDQMWNTSAAAGTLAAAGVITFDGTNWRNATDFTKSF